MGGDSYLTTATEDALFGRGLGLGVSASRSTEDSDDNMSLLTMSRSADDALAFHQQEHGPSASSTSSHAQRSLLAAFRFQLNSTLPEYCGYLSTAATDTARSAAAAAKAVCVLENGGKTLSLVFGGASGGRASSSSLPSSPTLRGERSAVAAATPADTHSSALFPSEASAGTSSSPRRDESPRKTPKSESVSTISPSKLADVSRWLVSPLSPRGSEEWARARTAGAMPPRRRQRHGQASNLSSVAESEWERFVSPLLMLVGAECLYGRMEHVLDPRARPSAATVRAGDGFPEEDFVQKAECSSAEDPSLVMSGPMDRDSNISDSAAQAPQSDSSKRGSRRLIAMYRQIREDCIIVGEYLCDPVLGSRTVAVKDDNRGGAVAMVQRMPPPPLHLDAASTHSSTALSPRKGDQGHVTLGGDRADFYSCTHTDHQRQELAAMSLRGTLDSLIGFVEARCVLIRIHAQCCASLQPVHPSLRGSADGGHRKWVTLAEQCRSVMGPVSAWAKEEGCMLRSAVSDIEMELRALELMLTSMHFLFECDLLPCVLNARRLYVHLQKIDRDTCLPITYIRLSLVELFAMMHVYFTDVGAGLKNLFPNGPVHPLHPSLNSRLQSNKKSFHKIENVSSKKSSGTPPDYNALFSKFTGKSVHGLPLAVAVVRRAVELDRYDEASKSSQRWEPIYMNSSSNNNNGGAGSYSPPEANSGSVFRQTGHESRLVRIIKENFSADRNADAHMSGGVALDDNENADVPCSRDSGWPFEDWADIEKVLTRHCTEPEKDGAYISRNVKQSVPAPKENQAGLRCHISSITDSILLIVIQGICHANRQSLSDAEILSFMRNMASKLSPENLLSIKVVLRAKHELMDVKRVPFSENDNSTHTSSLWSESRWSDAQKKKVLHSLGLRRKHSPLMTPLKSPYVKRQMSGKLGRHRKKKTKNSINHGHVDFFLGPELSRLL